MQLACAQDFTLRDISETQPCVSESWELTKKISHQGTMNEMLLPE